METISRHARSVALLIGLLFSFFLSMSYQVNRGETVSTVEGTIQTVLSPAQRIVSSVWLGISGAWANYLGMIGQATKVDALRQRIGQLELHTSSLEEAARENARLRQLLSLQASLEIPSIAAETIGRDFAHGYEAFSVNRGSRDGVVRNSAVVAPNGAIVGRLVHVGLWTSTVQLITDPKSAVGAKVARTGAHGVIHGAGDATLDLAYVTSLADVAEGDIVVTSGDDSIYPAGLEIGRVRRVGQGAPVPGARTIPLARNEVALFLDIEVRPLVEVRRVEHVLLLAPRSAGE